MRYIQLFYTFYSANLIFSNMSRKEYFNQLLYKVYMFIHNSANKGGCEIIAIYSMRRRAWED